MAEIETLLLVIIDRKKANNMNFVEKSDHARGGYESQYYRTDKATPIK